jgi:hypothetical protein
MSRWSGVVNSGLYRAMRRSATTVSAEEEQIVEQIRCTQRKHHGRSRYRSRRTG